MASLPLDKLSGYIWLNGELIDWHEAKVHVLTHSLHYGSSVYEGERAYNQKIFKLEEHTERLLNSAKTLYLKPNFTFDEINKACQEVLIKNNIQQSYVRPLIWRGSESLKITNKIHSTNIMIAALPSSPEPDYQGIKVHVSRWKKPHPESLPPQCKSSGHYTTNIIVQEEAYAAGYDDAIMLDIRGYIAECTTSNIFFVKDDMIVTPIADSFLNGITRQTIMDLAHKLGLVVKEKHLTLDIVHKYDECFITGTAAEVKPISQIDLADKQIIFEQNKITHLLMQEYADLVRR